MGRNPRISRFGIVAILASAITAVVLAADGDLDPGFGTGGKVATTFDVPSATANAVALQPDGKIVLAGWLFDLTANVDFAVARYNSDGSLDSTFGSGGKVRTDFFGYFDEAYAVAVQEDGKIVVAGTATTPAQPLVFALARYNADGSLDKTFGFDGRAAVGFFGIIRSITLLSDGKIVAGGEGFAAGSTSKDFMLARYEANGSLDAKFGTGGAVGTDIHGLGDGAISVLPLPGGKLLAVGSADSNVTGSDIALARYHADGSPDMTFGSGGKTTIDLFGRSEIATAAKLQPDGKIVISAGVSDPSQTGGNFSALRILPDGTLDPAFGNNGRASATLPGLDDEATWAIGVQPDGKVIVAGSAFGPALYDFALVRFDLAGQPDSTFGVGGAVVTDVFGKSDSVYGVVVQADGGIVAAGVAHDDTTGYFALARYLGTSPAPSACPRSSGYWKSHPGEWPSPSLVLGSQTYSSAEIAALLQKASAGDASVLLAKQLIAAKFNVLAGAGSPQLLNAVAAADALLSEFAGKLPYGVAPFGPAGRPLMQLVNQLASLNGGKSRPACHRPK